MRRRKEVSRTISARPDAGVCSRSPTSTRRSRHPRFATAVNNVSIVLERGKTLGIVGESGSQVGPSRSIMGLLPKHNVVREGSVRFEGKEIAGLSNTAMRAYWGTEMAMVFQDPMTSLNPVLKVGRQITESLVYHLDMDKRQSNETALALLKSVGIPEAERRLSEYPHQLSGGMRQRIVIAIALACGPKLLFADEPTTALDVTVQAQILNLLQGQQRERDMAMILVTHDPVWSPDGPTRSAVMSRARSSSGRRRACCSRRCGCRTRRDAEVDPEDRTAEHSACRSSVAPADLSRRRQGASSRRGVRTRRRSVTTRSPVAEAETRALLQVLVSVGTTAGEQARSATVGRASASHRRRGGERHRCGQSRSRGVL